MRLSQISLHVGLVVLAAIAALTVGFVASLTMEKRAEADIMARFTMEGIEGVEVEANGLQVTLSGLVMNEAKRFHAISATGNVVDSSRVVDQIEIVAAEQVTPPRFSIEILRNAKGISLIGLIPTNTDHIKLIRRIGDAADGENVADLLESADYAVPEKWEEAVDYALMALKLLERSKISVAANKVTITAIASSIEEKGRFEATLARAAPGGLILSINISAPRPVITPFTLRFTLNEETGARFDACSAHSKAGREVILNAARAAGVNGRISCTIGLGVPSPKWPQAVVLGIGAIEALKGGSLTFSDADITLIAPDTTPATEFDRITGELENALPEVFSLHAVLPEKVVIDGTGDQDIGPPEFIATLSPEGQVQLRGRLNSEIQRSVTESYARASFGVERVHVATRLDPDLPAVWSTRVLAALEALTYLSNGAVVVQPDVVDIRGNTGNSEASSEISRILSEKLGAAQDFRVRVTYKEELDPISAIPTPIECANKVNLILDTSKITFEPGSADIVASARQTMEKIAEVMKNCENVVMEIGGYTDSQGREEMNQALSQSRAQSVLNALLARRVLTTNLTAHGYGEENPIADNETEEGREANRRIEFRLILPDGGEETPDTGGETATETTGDQTGQATEEPNE